jgi:hypothetical protein
MPRGEAVSANYPETGAMSGRKINFVKRCACHARDSAGVAALLVDKMNELAVRYR